MKLHLKLVLVLVLFATKGVSQWEYRVNNAKKSIEAIGSVEFDFEVRDTVTLYLSKSRKLGLDFSIQANLFKRNQKYYVLLEIADRKIKVKRSLVLNKQLRILELEDLISNEKYEVEEFLKILKRGDACTLTIRAEHQVIQGYNSLSGSVSAINNVLNGPIL
ncbi:MAG TPA: hypothetical protein DIT52_06200 [Flavobacteriaceae bacterium]|jgi:hypothetical protein|nr:hypothetical protein [Flavobacteriaceae bacterium]|tara:strand:+ start:3380 stop:3865 length:486 start_codon:yes stop_codon:yes gene_type:complete